MCSSAAKGRRPTLAVAHHGVIRALYALASGWDMADKPPVKIREACAHRFEIAADGRPAVARMNIALNGADQS